MTAAALSALADIWRALVGRQVYEETEVVTRIHYAIAEPAVTHASTEYSIPIWLAWPDCGNAHGRAVSLDA